ncbi:MAG: exodeoxyribonuclease III [Bacteroidetes bacterium B1(2017)]|nr:MAG: exodeoxyribonuclease III [Bacteroidetes bacterium B1(2017)]
MKIISYNVNGIRSALSKGLLNFMQGSEGDVFCFQETKAMQNQVEPFLFETIGFTHHHWFSAEKKGYSGVAIYSKAKPDNIVYGFGNPEWDNEGRMVRADFGDISVISVYMPSGSSGEDRQAYKMHWLSFFNDFISELKKTRPNLVICGDYNICHKAIDIHDPVGNKNSSGFLPDEREWMQQFIDSGFTDSFRSLYPGPHNYSWWSYRANARANNKGWRIDYCMVANPIANRIEDAGILPLAMHSDHCPVWVKLKA